MSNPGYYSASPTAASSPFTYQGGQAAGQAVAATAGNVVSSVGAPVIGFAQGFLQGRLLLVALVIGAVILLDKSGGK